GGPAPFDASLGLGNLSAEGFDKLQLKADDQIQFAGDINVALNRGIRLDAPEFVAAPGTHSVSFSAPQLAFGGTPLNQAVLPTPAPGSMGAAGTAGLSLSTGAASSGLIELFGHTRLPGFGGVNITSSGDVRMSGLLEPDKTSLTPLGIALPGSFWTTGNVTIGAAQVYPTAFTSFTLGVDSRTGSITFAPAAGIQAPVYSAGGSLTLQASTIEQGGVVKAPLGQLTFDASSPSYASSRVDLLPGSVTSVSADG